MMSWADGAAQDLSDLLTRERACLIGGRFEEIAELGQRKAALLENLAARPGEAAALADLLARARANQRLAAAAAAGLRAAIRRLGEVERLGSGAGHYDRTGSRVPVAGGQRVLRRL
ncbi:hypothetical protein DKT77_17090 [Meridianimarinicoccus roseus]|uniref:Flagellar protein FlgN n=1 Tax=Meridianimarinicoccus roseus TaxID=2072018 RepID=A0A2V2LCE0_9RHOB|nr:hypothetical protein [Meridianimarinicoccus roseus]PWR01421.1 hypothetical protein DKT77_17090 [Meridianimarinicoccus roseus]